MIVRLDGNCIGTDPISHRAFECELYRSGITSNAKHTDTECPNHFECETYRSGITSNAKHTDTECPNHFECETYRSGITSNAKHTDTECPNHFECETYRSGITSNVTHTDPESLLITKLSDLTITKYHNIAFRNFYSVFRTKNVETIISMIQGIFKNNKARTRENI